MSDSRSSLLPIILYFVQKLADFSFSHMMLLDTNDFACFLLLFSDVF